MAKKTKKPETVQTVLEKINKEVLKQFDSYIEWLAYYDRMYPFWKTHVEGHVSGESDYKKWFGKMAESIRKGEKVIDNAPDVKQDKPEISFDYSEYRDPIVEKA
jgi:hypothetical protein